VLRIVARSLGTGVDFRAGGDPAAEQVDFRGHERVALFRHESFAGIVRRDLRQQFAGVGVARREGGEAAFAFGKHSVTGGEVDAAFSPSRLMTSLAPGAKDRQHVALETDRSVNRFRIRLRLRFFGDERRGE
jgi:hypothetical protein